MTINQLTFGYDIQGIHLFDSFSATFDTSWKLGLVGRNGRRKTTFMRILLGELPYQGTVQSEVMCVYFPQTIQNPTNITLYALMELAPFEQWQLEKELRQLAVDPLVLWQPFDTLSGGEQTKVLLALLFLDELNYPLLDEPTNHLDQESRQIVARYLREKKQGFMVVSHDRAFLNDVIDHVCVLEKTGVQLTQGDFAQYELQKARRDQFELAENAKITREMQRLEKTAQANTQWSQSREKDKYGDPKKKTHREIVDKGFVSARASRMMRRSQAVTRRLTNEVKKKATLLHDIEKQVQLTMNYRGTHHQRCVTMQDFQLTVAEQSIGQPFSMTVDKGERVVVSGSNGTGKTTLLRLLTDSYFVQKGLKISVVNQQFTDAHGSLTDFAEKYHLNYELFINNLRKLGVDRHVLQNSIETMSMGQQKRVALAKSLTEEADLYLWDEPLNYLDVFNQEQLLQVIQACAPTMVIVEHDETFVQKIATKVVTLVK